MAARMRVTSVMNDQSNRTAAGEQISQPDGIELLRPGDPGGNFTGPLGAVAAVKGYNRSRPREDRPMTASASAASSPLARLRGLYLRHGASSAAEMLRR